jgi:hypothetical protein
MTAAPCSGEQEAALIYCLDNASPELKGKIAEALANSHKGHSDDCGCG